MSDNPEDLDFVQLENRTGCVREINKPPKKVTHPKIERLCSIGSFSFPRLPKENAKKSATNPTQQLRSFGTDISNEIPPCLSGGSVSKRELNVERADVTSKLNAAEKVNLAPSKSEQEIRDYEKNGCQDAANNSSIIFKMEMPETETKSPNIERRDVGTGVDMDNAETKEEIELENSKRGRDCELRNVGLEQGVERESRNFERKRELSSFHSEQKSDQRNSSSEQSHWARNSSSDPLSPLENLRPDREREHGALNANDRVHDAVPISEHLTETSQQSSDKAVNRGRRIHVNKQSLRKLLEENAQNEKEMLLCTNTHIVKRMRLFFETQIRNSKTSSQKSDRFPRAAVLTRKAPGEKKHSQGANGTSSNNPVPVTKNQSFEKDNELVAEKEHRKTPSSPILALNGKLESKTIERPKMVDAATQTETEPIENKSRDRIIPIVIVSALAWWFFSSSSSTEKTAVL